MFLQDQTHDTGAVDAWQGQTQYSVWSSEDRFVPPWHALHFRCCVKSCKRNCQSCFKALLETVPEIVHTRGDINI